MEDLLRHGWSKSGLRSYSHYSGASTFQEGRAWTANKLDGELSPGHASAEAAIRWLVAHDPDYWTYGERCFGGSFTSGIDVRAGFLDADEGNKIDARDLAVVLSLSDGCDFPRRLEASFKRLFLDRAKCARCGSPPKEVILRPLHGSGSGKKKMPYSVCGCGYRVWRISWDAYNDAAFRLRRSEYSEVRKARLIASGGKHRRSEIEKILRSQNHRCIYCNREFGDGFMPARDHLTPVCMGGTDWALNIVISCHSCNSRRETIPFRTYCRLLSPTQNRRILRSLARRVAEIHSDGVPIGAFASFCEAISAHNPRHWKYRSILRMSAVATRNAATNELLPGKPSGIIRRALAQFPGQVFSYANSRAGEALSAVRNKSTPSVIRMVRNAGANRCAGISTGYRMGKSSAKQLKQNS